MHTELKLDHDEWGEIIEALRYRADWQTQQIDAANQMLKVDYETIPAALMYLTNAGIQHVREEQRYLLSLSDRIENQICAREKAADEAEEAQR